MKPIRKILFSGSDAASVGDDAVLTLDHSLTPEVRSFGAMNVRGCWMLLCREVYRFAKLWPQTIISPLVMTLLFCAVFSIGVGGPRMVAGIPYLKFLLPGLVMMAMAQSAFMNCAASLVLAKIEHNIVDTLMAPLSPFELTLAYALSGMLRGLVVGAVTILALWPFQPMMAFNLAAVAYFSIAGCLMLSLIGLITGILGDKFDHLGTVQNFIVLPATFLSGTFFPLSGLPEKAQLICALNPFFYMIDGFRYGFTGVADGSIIGGIGMLFTIVLVLFTIAYWLFANGTRLKA